MRLLKAGDMESEVSASYIQAGLSMEETEYNPPTHTHKHTCQYTWEGSSVTVT